jgi:hypothetical protein
MLVVLAVGLAAGLPCSFIILSGSLANICRILSRFGGDGV